MPFLIVCGTDGQPVCKCCRDMLWHCKRCWAAHHNHLGDCSDYEQPEYYGQPMSEDIHRIMKKHNLNWEPHIKPNKNKDYEEGDYHH